MKRIPVAGYIDQDGKSVITRYAEMTVDPRELAAAERAVVEVAIAYDKENKNLQRAMALGKEMSKAVAELLRLRAAQESGTNERNLDK